MDQIITGPALRIKITGICNRSCSFCNEEGGMRTIDSIKPTELFFQCVRVLTETLQIKRIMITGGEPTIHPDLYGIIHGISAPQISITTNGIRFLSMSEWTRLYGAGLRKVIISFHDTTPQSFIQLDTHKREYDWAVSALESQKHNLITASEAGLHVRVNTVVYHSHEQVCNVLRMLGAWQQKYHFDIRLLNDLANVEKSQQIIHEVCHTLGARVIQEKRRAGSSNVTMFWKANSGFRFSTKTTQRYFFDPVCSGCQIKKQCHEGFYGIRIEQRMSEYWIRLCVYKNTPDVLMPWRSFLYSNLAKQYKDLCQQEQLCLDLRMVLTT